MKISELKATIIARESNRSARRTARPSRARGAGPVPLWTGGRRTRSVVAATATATKVSASIAIARPIPPAAKAIPPTSGPTPKPM